MVKINNVYKVIYKYLYLIIFNLKFVFKNDYIKKSWFFKFFIIKIIILLNKLYLFLINYFKLYKKYKKNWNLAY